MALRYSTYLSNLRTLHRTQALLSDYWPAGGCWSMGNAAASAGAAAPFTGLRAGRSSGRRRRAAGTAGPFQGLRAGREDAAVDSAGAAAPSKELRA